MKHKWGFNSSMPKWGSRSNSVKSEEEERRKNIIVLFQTKRPFIASKSLLSLIIIPFNDLNFIRTLHPSGL